MRVYIFEGKKKSKIERVYTSPYSFHTRHSYDIDFEHKQLT